jgi:hypothetical protein
VAGNRERREHQVWLERGDSGDVDLQVGPDARQRGDDGLGIVAVIVDPDQLVATTERADDLRVRASQRDDAHDNPFELFRSEALSAR